jgi:DNA-binding response OmpR family regulator
VLCVPRILVVDDTPGLRMLIRINLELEGFDVQEAVDGRDALDCLEALDDDDLPDLITFDVVMPRMDGFDAAAAVRADLRYADVALVMVTTQAGPADMVRAREIGVDAYVTKPFEPEELTATLHRVLAARAARGG